MKKPLFNLEDRLDIKHKTRRGAFLELHIAVEKLKRDIYKQIIKDYEIFTNWIFRNWL